MNPELDPELAELMALEEGERESEATVAPGALFDPEIAELMRLEAEERGEGNL